MINLLVVIIHREDEKPFSLKPLSSRSVVNLPGSMKRVKYSTYFVRDASVVSVALCFEEFLKGGGNIFERGLVNCEYQRTERGEQVEFILKGMRQTPVIGWLPFDFADKAKQLSYCRAA